MREVVGVAGTTASGLRPDAVAAPSGDHLARFRGGCFEDTDSEVLRDICKVFGGVSRAVCAREWELGEGI